MHAHAIKCGDAWAYAIVVLCAAAKSWCWIEWHPRAVQPSWTTFHMNINIFMKENLARQCCGYLSDDRRKTLPSHLFQNFVWRFMTIIILFQSPHFKFRPSVGFGSELLLFATPQSNTVNKKSMLKARYYEINIIIESIVLGWKFKKRYLKLNTRIFIIWSQYLEVDT